MFIELESGLILNFDRVDNFKFKDDEIVVCNNDNMNNNKINEFYYACSKEEHDKLRILLKVVKTSDVKIDKTE